MSRITMEIPDESLLALKLSDEEAEPALRMAAAVKLFELAYCRDAVEGLNAKLGAVLFARCLSYIRASDEGKSRRFRYRLR